MKTLSNLSLSELQTLLKDNGIDSSGPVQVLRIRLKDFQKDSKKQLFKPEISKKRSKKKKVSCKIMESEDSEEQPMDLDIQVEIEHEKVEFHKDFKEFEDVLQRFNQTITRKGEKEMDLEEMQGSDQEEFIDKEEIIQTRKKQRKVNRMTVAQLKQIVQKPEVVEWVDVTASDPLLLITLKSTRNTVPVPDHWSLKRKYLQGKRGMEKPPFELPEYIKATGIMQLRQSHSGPHSLQGKLRERHHPKLGRLDIDYQKLHDAFFRYQTKPAFSSHGDIYFEGKEFETRLRMRKPGVVTEELKEALNIPKGAPPPWLINMQKYGPPPSYPQLKIPGLNAPIPSGAQWGFHPGGWGKPPTDEYNRPLYGDVFGTQVVDVPSKYIAPIESTPWGEVVEEEEEEEEEAEEEEEEEDDLEEEEAEEEESGLETPSGISSYAPSGVETPVFQPRSQPLSTGESKPLFQVLSQKETSIHGFMGSTHTYELPSSRTDKLNLANKTVDVALNPEDLESLDQDTLKRKYTENLEKSTVQTKHEDLSDMVQEHAQKQSMKRPKLKDGKKKDFKF